MLTTLRHAGWLARVAAIAVGQLTKCDPGPDGREIPHVLEDRLGDLGIPVVTGVPSGHDEVNRELPLGAPVVVDADGATLLLEHPAVVAKH